MNLTRSLNIAIPVDRDDGATVWVHAMPIGEAVFDRYFMPLSRAYAAIFAEGLGPVIGSQQALRILRRQSIARGEWEGPEGVERGLVAEITRLANAIAPVAPIAVAMPATDTEPAKPPRPSAWQPIPLDDAVKSGAITEEDAAEVVNALVFFTAVSWISTKRERPELLGRHASFLDAQIISSNCTEFARSLPTLTVTANSGESPSRSSIPS